MSKKSKKEVESSSSESDSDSSSEEEKKVATKKDSKNAKKDDSSSSDSSSDSDSSSEEEVKTNGKKIASKKSASSSSESDDSSDDSSDEETTKAKPTKAKKDDSSSESSDSDSEDEAPKDKKAVATKNAAKDADSSSESDSSDSDEDKKPKKAAKQEAKKDDSSSESDSDSDDESEEEDKKASNGKKVAAKKDESSSSESDSSDEEEEEKPAPKRKLSQVEKVEQEPIKKAHKNGEANGNGATGEVKLTLLGVPYECTEQEVIDFFKQIPVLSVEFPQYKKGTAVVTFGSQSDADQAKTFDRQYIGQRYVTIRDFFEKKGFGGDDNKGRPEPGAEPPADCTTIFCGNLSFQIDDDAIKDFFKDCGEIKQVRWGMDKETEQFKGFGFVEFFDSESCKKAMNMQGHDLLGRDIRLDFAQSKKRDTPGGNGPRKSFGDKNGGGPRKSFGSAGGNRNGGGFQKKSNNFQGNKITF